MSKLQKFSSNHFKKLSKFIIKKSKKLYYHFLWHGKLAYKCYDVLDILNAYLDIVKISSIKTDKYYIDITFSDGSTLNLWNDDRYTKWMYRGEMEFSNGRKMKWSEKSPSYEILCKYKKVVLKYEKDELKRKKESENMKYFDCIPVKYLRREKLKKFKK